MILLFDFSSSLSLSKNIGGSQQLDDVSWEKLIQCFRNFFLPQRGSGADSTQMSKSFLVEGNSFSVSSDGQDLDDFSQSVRKSFDDHQSRIL